MKKFFAVLALMAASCFTAPAATFYIASYGSDSNTGTSIAVPWAHLPGMASATGNAAAYTPVAGDQFILRGGDTWGNSNFPISWSWSGSSGNVIYVGVDKTWYTGASWVRPVWDAQSAEIGGSNVHNYFANMGSSTYVTFDNIEMKNIFWSGSTSFGGVAFLNVGGSQNFTLENSYLHAWTHGTTGAGTSDDLQVTTGALSSPFNPGNTLIGNTIDGGSGQDSGEALHGAWQYIENNTFANVPTAVLYEGNYTGGGVISGNLIYNVGISFTGNHENAIENDSGTNGGTWYTFNNVIHDSDGEADFMAPPGATEYIWNNVWYNLNENPPETGDTTSGNATVYMWNNTIVAPAGGNCIRVGHTQTVVALTFENNHCITTNGAAIDPTFSNPTTSNNLLQTPTVANGQGYTSSQTYAYSPTASNNSTVGAGVNLTGTCSGSVVSLCKDTTYGIARTPNNRPSGGVWDIGAYEFVSGGAPVVSFSPTSLAFGNQSVGTTSAAQTTTLTNTGTASLSISSITATGTNTSDFTVTSPSATCPSTVVVNATCIINGTFSPTATGSRSANISVADNASGSPQTVPLSGTGVAGGAGSVVQHTTAVCTPAVTCTATFASAVATGDYIIAAAFDGFATNQSIIFTDGVNTYTQALFGGHAYCNLATDGDTVGMSYAQAASSSAFSVTMADGGNSSNKRLAIMEVNGLTGIDKTACGDQTSTTVSSGNTATTSQASETLIGFVGNAHATTLTVGSGFSLLDTVPTGSGNNRIANESQIVSSTGAYAAVFGQASSIEAAVILGTFTIVGAPTISSLSVTSGNIGSAFTINGTNFGASQGGSTATLNGAALTINSWTATAISVTVPSGAVSGNVIVTTTLGSSNGVAFTVTPFISSLSVSSGPVGTNVTITGTGFQATQGSSSVVFNSIKCTVGSWSATSITCPVPSGATTGNVVVVVGFSNSSNGVAFTVTPTITSLSPTSGLPNTSVTIAGTTFGASQGSSTVKFNGVTASCSSWAASSLSCTVPSSATTGNVVVTTSAGASNGVSFTVLAPPVITSLTPNAGLIGSSVTIAGSGFGSSQGSSTVAFNSVSASCGTWTATSLTCTVPNGATTGSVVVTTSVAASNGVTFTVQSLPVITSLTPNAGVTGSSVTIAGSAFGPTQGGSTVKFYNAQTATCGTWSATSLTCTVPGGATTGSVVVTTSVGASNGVTFTVTAPAYPSISSLTPNVGLVGSSVIISGTNFGSSQGGSTIAFNGTPVTSVSSWTATSITCLVPTGATTGNVVVTTGVGASNGVNFTVTTPSLPTITSLTPNAGVVGTSVTIAGSNFGSSQGGSTVVFNSVPATCGTWTTTSLVCTVPSTTTGSVVVTTTAGSSNGVTFTVTPSLPTITSLTPNAGPVGTSVTIAGTNFGSSQGGSTAKFNGVSATCGTWTAASLTCTVPSTTTGSVIVTTGAGASNAVTFTVQSAPIITSLTPNAGLTGTSVTIAGSGFEAPQGASTVTFNAVLASCSFWSDTLLTCVVPVTATTGGVVVTSTGPSNSVIFTVIPPSTNPVISSVTPTAGLTGIPVTIIGQNFGATQSGSTVTFNGVSATVSSWSATSIVCVVPSGITSGNIVVTVSSIQSNGVPFIAIPFAFIQITGGKITNVKIQ